MRLLILLLMVAICIVSAKYLPDETNNSKQLLSRNKRSDSEESTTSEDENNSDDDEDIPDHNEGKERTKFLAKIEKMRQKLLEKQEKERQKQEEAERKLEEKVARELRKEEEKRQKEERKQREKLERERKKLEEEHRKIQQKLLENERKRQEKIQKQLEEIQNNISKEQDEDKNSLESNTNDSIELKDFWKKHIYTKYGITEANTNLEKKAAFRRYMQEELGLNINSTESERRQAVLQLVQNKLQNPLKQNTLRNELIKYINVVGVQKIRANLEKEIEEMNNKTEILNNVNLPWVLTAKQNVAEQVTFLKTIEQYLSNILPNWFTGNRSTSETQVDMASKIVANSILSNNLSSASSLEVFQSSSPPSTNAANVIGINQVNVNTNENNVAKTTEKGTKMVSTVTGSGSSIGTDAIITKNVSPTSIVDALSSSSSPNTNAAEVTGSNRSVIKAQESIIKGTTETATSVVTTSNAGILSGVPDTILLNKESPGSVVDTILSSSSLTTKATGVTGNNRPVVNTQEKITKETTEPAISVAITTVAGSLPGVSDTLSNNKLSSVSAVDASASSSSPTTKVTEVSGSNRAVVYTQESIIKETTEPAISVLSMKDASLLSSVSDTPLINKLSSVSAVDPIASSSLPITKETEVTGHDRPVINTQESIIKETTESATSVVSTKAASLLSGVSDTFSINKLSSVSAVDTIASSSLPTAKVTEVTGSNGDVVNKQESIIKETTEPAISVISTTAASLLSGERDTVLINKVSPGSIGDTISSSLSPNTNAAEVTGSNKIVESTQESIIKETTVPETVVILSTAASASSVVSDTVLNNTVDAFLVSSPSGTVETEVTGTLNETAINTQESIIKETTEKAIAVVSTTPAGALSGVNDTILSIIVSPFPTVDITSSSSPPGTNATEPTGSNRSVVNTKESIIAETTVPETVVVSSTAASVSSVVSDTILNNTVDSFLVSSPPGTVETEITGTLNETAINTQDSFIKETTESAIAIVSTTSATASSVVSETILNNTVDTFLSSSSSHNNKTEITGTVNKTAFNTQESIITQTVEPAIAVVSTTTAGALSGVSDTNLMSKVSSGSVVDTISSSSSPNTNAAEVVTETKVAISTQESIMKQTTESAIGVISTTVTVPLSGVNNNNLNNIVQTASTGDAISSSLSPSTVATEITTRSKSLVNTHKNITEPGVVATPTVSNASSVVSDTMSNYTFDALISASPSGTNETTEVTGTVNKTAVNIQESIIKETTEPAIVVLPTTATSVLSVVSDFILNNFMAPVSTPAASSSSLPPTVNATEETTVSVTKSNNFETSHIPIETQSTASLEPNTSNSNAVFSKVDNFVTVNEPIRVVKSSSDVQTSIVKEGVMGTNQTSAGKNSTSKTSKDEASDIQKPLTENVVQKGILANTSSKVEISTEQSIITSFTEQQLPSVASTNTEGKVLKNEQINVKEIPIINIQVPLEQGASIVDIAKQ